MLKMYTSLFLKVNLLTSPTVHSAKNLNKTGHYTIKLVMLHLLTRPEMVKTKENISTFYSHCVIMKKFM